MPAAVAARAVSNGRRKDVLIYSDVLQEELSRRWAANMRRCTVRLKVAATGEVLTAEASVALKNGRYYLYPRGAAQQVLRLYYERFREGRQRRPLPLLIEELAFAQEAAQ